VAGNSGAGQFPGGGSTGGTGANASGAGGLVIITW
jgi:hypothetical protein